MNWTEFFNYENGKLYWKEWKSGRRKSLDAGCLNKAGYVIIGMPDKTLHYAHRIIWEIHNGKIKDELMIDHINHIKSDNNIENLRVVDRSGNSKNIGKVNSNSGFMGVYVSNKGKSITAQVTVNGISIHLGSFSSIESAVIARDLANKTYGFHKNHGK